MSMPRHSVRIAQDQGVLFPDIEVRPHFMLDKELGGIGINDPSEGINTHVWEAYLDDEGFIALRLGDTPVQWWSAPTARELTFTFDQNMNPVVAWMAADVLYYRWYDTLAAAYTLSTLTGCHSPFLTHDDKRPESVQIGSTDILLFYIKGSTLCYRVQRDRYLVERVLATFIGPRLWIRRCGMNEQFRMQIEILGSDAKVIT